MDEKEFDKKVKEADTIISSLIRENRIDKLSEQEKTKFVDFYRKQANLSLIAADLLYNISTEKSSKEFYRLEEDYECFLWAINSSYYSMFYAIHALLASKGIRIVNYHYINEVASCFIDNP